MVLMAKSCAELVVKLLWKMPRRGEVELVFWILRTPLAVTAGRLGSGVTIGGFGVRLMSRATAAQSKPLLALGVNVPVTSVEG